MHRPVWFRVLITLWGIWFTTALTEPAGLFACAMHSGMVSPSAVGGMAMPMGMSMPMSASAHHEMRGGAQLGSHTEAVTGAAMSGSDAVMLHHHDAMLAQESTSATPDQAPTHDCCTCIGQCGVAVVVAAPVHAIELTVATLDAVSVPAFTHHAHVPLARAHALPFANGPPLRALL